MCIYTCIMQIRAENQNLVSALSITINKILCQFFEFTQNLKRSQEAGLLSDEQFAEEQAKLLKSL